MGRPTVPLLDRDRIGAAALALVDTSGDFSMPALAAALDVAVSSLYHHVEGRADVVELVRSRVVAEIDLEPLDHGAWDDGLRGWLTSYRAAFAAHPAAIRLLATTAISDPRSQDMYERAVACLERGGFALADVVALITAAESFVLGSALDLAAPPSMLAPGEQRPRLGAAVRAAGARGGHRADAAFAVGLDALLAGMRVRLSPPPAGT